MPRLIDPQTQQVIYWDAILPIGNILFVDANGNDFNSGSFDKPLLTLSAAKTLATAGMSIHVRPGNYIGTNLLKNNVNWYFHSGSVVTNTSNTTSLFDDYVSGANGAVTCKISGEGNFICTTGQGILYLRNASVISIFANSLSAVGSTITSRGAELYVHANKILSTGTSGNAAVWWYDGPCFIEANLIQGSGPAVVYSTAPVGNGISGYFWVRAKYISNNSATISSTYKAVWVQDTEVTARVWIDAMEIEGPIAINSTSAAASLCYVKAEKIFGQINSTGVGFLYLDSQKLSGFGLADTLITMTGGSSWLNISQIDDAAIVNQIAVSISGGTHYLTGRSLKRGTNGDAIAISAGVITVSGLEIITQATYKDLNQSSTGILNVLSCSYNLTKITGTINPTDPSAVGTLTLNTSGLIHNTPTIFSNIAGAWSATQTLTNQAANTFLGNGTSGSATPTFMNASTARTSLSIGHLVAAPTTSSDIGAVGDYANDTSFHYVCTATNTWKRVALSTW